MTIQQLKYLIAIIDEGGIREAAKKCKVSQPTVTIQIKKLEDELRVELFDRSTVPVVPTLLGNRIALQARVALKEIDLINDIIQNYRKGIQMDARQPIITKDKELQKELKNRQRDIIKAIRTAKELHDDLISIHSKENDLLRK